MVVVMVAIRKAVTTFLRLKRRNHVPLSVHQPSSRFEHVQTVW